MKLVEEEASINEAAVPDESTDQWQALKETLSPPRTNPLQLTTEENIVHCPHCSKPVMDSVLDAHKAHCVLTQQQRQQAAAAPPAKPSLVITLSSNSTATVASTTSGSKKKPPPDPDRNCFVPLPNGQVCLRSLTCKTHSISSKRAVQRSQPYDVLLAALQAAAAPKQTATANADAASSVVPSTKPTPASKKRKRAFGEVSASSDDDVDSDAEVDGVIDAIQRAGKPATIELFYGAGSGYSNKSRWIGRNLKTERMRELIGGLFSPQS